MADVKASTTGMSSSYNENSKGQAAAFQHFWPWLGDALRGNSGLLLAEKPNLLVYTDYGCSNGGNAAKQLTSLTALLKEIHIFGEVRAILNRLKALRGLRHVASAAMYRDHRHVPCRFCCNV